MDPEKQFEETKDDAIESRSVFHDDENLQDEQEQFDKDNAGVKIDWAAFDEMMKSKKADESSEAKD